MNTRTAVFDRLFESNTQLTTSRTLSNKIWLFSKCYRTLLNRPDHLNFKVPTYLTV